MGGARKANRASQGPTGPTLAVLDGLDQQLRLLLRETWASEAPPPGLLGLGQPALERLLDAPDSAFWPTDLEWRDYGGNRRQAVAAFARKDMAGVLRAMDARKWTDVRVALSGVGLVTDARVVPHLVGAYAGADPMTRSSVVYYLGFQRDARATAAAVRALTDRSSEVRLAAVRALGSIGDPGTIEALQAIARRAGSLAAREARQAVEKISRVRPRGNL